MKCLQSPEYLAALGEVIGHAINTAKYVSAVHALYGLDFPLLSQLESQKDASIADIMSLLHLKGPVAETLEASQLQPSYEQLLLLIYLIEHNVVIRETSLSFLLDVVHARVQRIKGDVASRWLSLSDAMVPLIEPLSADLVARLALQACRQLLTLLLPCQLLLLRPVSSLLY
ncbi:hypothetical protein Tco_1245196 [Tanacetum coccineum]